MNITIRILPKLNSTPSSVPPTRLSAWLQDEIARAKRLREDVKDEVSTKFAEGVFKELLKCDIADGSAASHILTDAEADKLARMACDFDKANDFNDISAQWHPADFNNIAIPDPSHDIKPASKAPSAFYPCGCPKTAQCEAIDSEDDTNALLAMNEAIQDALREVSTPATQPSPYSRKDVKSKEAFRSAREKFANEMPYMKVQSSPAKPAPSKDAEAFRWAEQILKGLGIKKYTE